ncbi:hypothetical protein JHW43_005002 [Diplocarpon mali]|nr:hypothetical protein JHW43_005002 [Diplocarpon mali]
MFSTRFIAAAAASLSLISSASAAYDAGSRSNVVMYYGQGSDQSRLKYLCDRPDVDIIPLAFINVFPSKANGLVGANFGNQCWASYGYHKGPGYGGNHNADHDRLHKRCPFLQDDIHYCQTKTNKKILLSLGGQLGDYHLNGEAEGEHLADFLWKAYGPYDEEWVKAGGVRPLDGGFISTDLTRKVDVDGFDFDIENPSPDGQAGYIAAINRLRAHFDAHKRANPNSKTYLISGSPQCPLPEQNMGRTISEAKFDMLFIQFYNNRHFGCTARNFIDKTGHFNYEQWVRFVNAGKSKGAKLHIGLLGSPEAAARGAGHDYLKPREVKTLLAKYHWEEQFGGVMIWENTHAARNNRHSAYPQMDYLQVIKHLLLNPAPPVTRSSTVGSIRTETSSLSTKVYSPSAKPTSNSVSSSQSSTSALPTYEASSPSSGYPATYGSHRSSGHISHPISSRSSVSSYGYARPTEIAVSRNPFETHRGQYYAAPASAFLSFTHHSTRETYSKFYALPTGSSWPVVSSAYPTGIYRNPSPALPSDVSDYPVAKASNSSSLPNTAGPTRSYGMAPTGISTPGCSGGECPLGSYPPAAKYDMSPAPPSECTGRECPLGSSPPVVKYAMSPPPSKCTGGECPLGSSPPVAKYPMSPPPSKCTGGECPLGSSPPVAKYPMSPPPSQCTGGACPFGSYPPAAKYPMSPPPSQCTGGACPFDSYPPAAKYPMSPPPSQCTGGACPFNSYPPAAKYPMSPPPSKCTGGACPYGFYPPVQKYTTSTVYATNVQTITWCPPSVPDCSLGSVTTKTIAISTTVCPVTTTPAVQYPMETLSKQPTTTPAPSVSVTKYTTKTVYKTAIYTITSCPPAVPECTSKLGQVTTQTIKISTTVCPVEEPTVTPVPSVSVTKYTTSTVYKTAIYTITSCPPAVPECTSKLGHITTQTIKISTTVCPVTDSEPTKIPAGPAAFPTYPEGDKYPSYPQGGESPQNGGAVPSHPEGGEYPSHPQGGESPNNGGAVPSYPEGDKYPSHPQGGESPNNGGAVPSYPEGGDYPSYPQGGEYPNHGGAVPSYPEGDEYPPSTSTLESTTTIHKPGEVIRTTATVIPKPHATKVPYPYGGGESPSYPAAPYPYESPASPSAPASAPPNSTANKFPIYATGAASSSKSTIGLVVAFAAGAVAYLI